MVLKMKVIKNKKGFTLIESLISVLLISIVSISLSNIFISSIKTTCYSKENLKVNALAQTTIEDLKVSPIDKGVSDEEEFIGEEIIDGFQVEKSVKQIIKIDSNHLCDLYKIKVVVSKGDCSCSIVTTKLGVIK